MLIYMIWKELPRYFDAYEVLARLVLSPFLLIFDIVLAPLEILALIITMIIDKFR